MTKALILTAVCSLPALAANIAVPAGGNLQSALNQAHAGDTVRLAAGASFVGHYRLAANAGPGVITIQSSAMGSLPSSGNRVSAANAGAMPKLISSDGGAALLVPSGANYYKIQGIEVAPASGVYAQDLVQVGTAAETSTGSLPHDIDFDRVYVHGDPSAGTKRGIALNGGSTTVENSYFSAFTSRSQDTQALCGWNGPGPYNILNNYLEAGTETVAFGGAPTAIQGVIPSDIIIRGNSFFKPLSWRGKYWVKNHIEFKNAQRVTIDGNTFENNWVGADQRGFAFVFQVRTEYGNVPWATVSNITISNNRITHSAAGADFGAVDDSSPDPGTSFGFTVSNNVWDDISSTWGGDGRLFQMTGGMKNMTFNRNTAFQTGYITVFDSGIASNINFTNNIFLVGGGVAGNSTAPGTATLNYWDKGGTFRNNILIGGSASSYPAGNFFPPNVNAVGFVDYANGDYRLSTSSPYAKAATDGGPIGETVQFD